MLSILIPSYNHAPFVEEAIASARSIDVPGRRIIVIDDASTDGTADVIDRYLQREGSDGIEFIRKPVNRGAIDSVNTFLSMCKTEYVYFMASDDIAVASGLQSVLARLESTPSLQFVVGGGINVFPDGSSSPIYGRKHEVLFNKPHSELLRTLFLTNSGPLLCQSSIFRLSAIKAVGGFNPALIADDYSLFARLFTHYGTRSANFDFMPEALCVQYRHHGCNSYRNLPRQAYSVWQVINESAPKGLRAQAAGYQLAHYALVALKRRDLRSFVQVVRLANAGVSPWLAAGMFVNAYRWLTAR